MEKIDSLKGRALFNILTLTFLYDAIIILLLYFSKSYIFTFLLKIILIIFNIFQLYYISTSLSIKFIIDDDSINIITLFGLKKVKILLKDIEAYNTSEGKIKGIKLTGYGNNSFAIGRSIIDKIGTVSMYVMSNKNIVYLKTADSIYGISPKNFNEVEDLLDKKGIKKESWSIPPKKNINLFKNKKYLIALILTSIVIFIIMVYPFLLYLKDKLPATMPLTFDANFNPVKIGTGKQFAFKQMTYGFLNMAILCMMYYASHFYAKYDERHAYKFIYISLVIAILFLCAQIKILTSF